jgi:hypothetical protein
MPKKTSKKEENKLRKKIKMNKNIEEERNTWLFQKKSKKMWNFKNAKSKRLQSW